MSCCECNGPGFCNRHQIDKCKVEYIVCKTHPDECKKLDVLYGVVTEPSIVQKAVNLTEATAEHIADGLVNVTEEEQSRRMAICQSCPFFVAGNATCLKCGCYLKTKTAWRSGKCPDNPPRW